MPAVASFTTSDWATATAVVLTKPSGLAEGDGLVAILAAADDAFDTPEGWTLLESDTTGDSDSILVVFTKVASAGDAAATDFTFENSVGSELSAGALLRITSGAISAIVSEITPIVDDNTPAYVGVTPALANSLLIIGVASREAGETMTHGSYAIATSNPSWTEIFDDTAGAVGFAVAHASRPEATATGNVTLTITPTGGAASSVGVIIAIPPITNASISPAVVNMVASINVPDASGNATMSAPAVISMTATAQGASPTTPDPEWTNTDKSNAPNWSNTDKS